MRNLKKLFAVLLTVAMLASIMVPALAAEGFKYETEAEQLYDLGLFKGVSDTEYKPELETVLTRETGLVLVIRAMGMEEEVQAMTAEEIAAQLAKVEDLDTIYDWAHPYVAYALKTGLTNGIGGAAAGMVKYAGQLELTGKEFVNFMLKGLGYNMNDKWDQVATEAATAGLPVALSVNYGANNAAINRDVAVGLIDGFMAAKNSAGVTMAQALVDAGAVDAEKMAEYGYFTPTVAPTEAPEELEIVATVDNLVQVNLTFNTDLDKESAEDADNYDIDDVDVAGVALQEDGRTVVLTFDFDDAKGQQDVIDITVDGVKDADGAALDEYTVEDIEFVDTTIPTAVDATVVGSDTFKVTFSEPMKGTEEDGKELKKSDFSVNNGKSYVKEVRLQNNNTEALVELYNDLQEGEVTLQVKSGSEDFAGFGVISKTFTLDVVKDEEAPVVIGYEKASRSEVTLIWSEDIEFNGSKIVLGDYYHTNAKNTVLDPDETDDPDDVPVKIDGNKMTLYFDDDFLMPNGTSYVYVLKEAVRDLWNNKNTQQMIAVEIEIDVTAPEVDKIEVKEDNKIEITFTEELDKGSAEDDDNYTILDDKGDELDDIIDDIDYSSKKVTMTFEESLSGDYSIAIENVEDKAGNEIVSTTVDFNVGDIAAPKSVEFKGTLYRASEKDQMIKIDFDDVMETEGKYSVTDIENYVIVKRDGTEECKLEKIEDVVINVVDDGKSVEIFVPSKKDVEDDIDKPESKKHFFDFTKSTDDGQEISDYYIQISRVADAAGNKMDKMVEVIEVSVSDTIDIEKVEVTARDTVEVTFKDKLADFEEDDLELTIGGFTYTNKEIAGVDTKENSDGNTVAIFTLDDDEDNLLPWNVSETESIALYVTIVDEDEDGKTESENRYKKTLTIGQTVKAADKIRPELVDDGLKADSKDVGDYLNYEVDNTAGTVTFAVYFTEDMKTTDKDLALDYALVGSDFAIYYDRSKDALVNGTDYSVIDIDGNMVVIEVDVTKLVDGKDVTGGKQYEDKADFEIELVSSPSYLTDKAGNKPDSEEFGTIDIEDVEFDYTDK